MKILIAVPTFENIQPEVFKAIYNLKSEHELHFDFFKGYDCAIARNEIAKTAQAKHYDYVLMVDSDTIIPEDTLELMLEDPVDVCLGVCPRKNTKDGKKTIVVAIYLASGSKKFLERVQKFPAMGASADDENAPSPSLEGLNYVGTETSLGEFEGTPKYIYDVAVEASKN